VAFNFTEEDFAPKSKFDFTEEDFKPSGLPKFSSDLALIPPTEQDTQEALAQSHPLTALSKPIVNLIPKIGQETMGRILSLPAALARQRIEETPDEIIETPEGSTAVAPKQPALEAVAKAVPSDKAVAVATGVQHAAADTANFFTSPIGIATLGIGSLPAAVGRTVALGFAAQMAKDVPEIAKQLGEELGKPEDQRDYEKISELTANAVANTTFVGLGVKHGLAEPVAGKLGALPSEQTAVIPTAQPKEENASTQQKAAEIYGDVLPQPRQGEGEVPIKEGESRVQLQTEGGIQKEVTPATTLENVIRDPNAKANNHNSTEAGMAVKSVDDLEKLAALREQLYKERQDLLEQVRTETDPAKKESLMNQALILSNKLQLPREAIEVATNTGGWAEEAGKTELGERPLDWKKNPEVANWLEKNSKRIGTSFERPKEAAPTETVLASQTTPTHGLPVGVPDRGPTFAADLMEASRQLGALVRSRATLRPGVLGQFVRTKLAGIKQADKIEVGDIRNQNTVAHEIGHSLDGILWPQINFGESQKSLAARVGTGTPKEITSELTKVSELMRGPMTGSKGHVAYRKRATELIADYFSLYAHDRDRAAAMAPKFTKGFEASLAKDQNTADVVKGVVSGNVIPKPPDPTLKKQLAGITGTPPQPGTALPGQVPAAPVLPPPARERVAAVAAEGLVKDAVRTFESKVQKARIVGDNWRKLVGSQSDRNDVGAFVEGIGNLEKPGDTIDRVRTRMTPDKERLAKDYRFRQELERQEINKYLKDSEEGEYLKFLEDYLGHFYVDNAAKRQAAVSRWAKESPHAKQRKLPTLKEAVDMGLTPITQDPAVTYELNSRINWQVATNRKFVAKLKDIKTGAGQDVVVPAKDAPAGWEVTNNPLIQRVYARQTPSGLMLWRGGAAIHPDIWRSARQILEAPQSGDLGKAYDAINGFTRANAFAFSLFHDLTLRSAAVGSQSTLANPLRGLVRLFERHPITGERQVFVSTRGLGKELLQNEEAVSDAAEHGLKFSYTDSEAYQHNARTFLEKNAARLRDVPVLGKATRLARDIQQWRQEGLWKNTHDAFKIITYNDMVSKALDGAPPGTDVKAVKENIASFLNDAYGGQEWQTKFWLDPGTRKVLSRFFLAPDWTLSTLRSVPGLSDVASTVREQAPRIAGRESFPTPKEGLAGAGKRLRFWGTEVAALAMATAAAQYAIYKAFGDDKKGDKAFPWDNELNQKMRVDVTPLMRKLPWADPKDPTRHYVNLGKRPQEILNWFTEPDKQVLSKASRPVAMIFEQVTGSEGDFKAPWKQDHESFMESLPSRAKAIGTEALPFTFRGNQFALSAPVRKGMTKYKAQQAYESVFELATNPNRIKSLLRGQQPSEGTLSEMTSQITDAAKRNGVPAEEVLKRSLSVVRGHHYDEFFKAFSKGDRKKMDEEAKALITLGATGRGIEESVKRRLELQPVAPE
jgi:hypothetical protein